MLKLLSRFTPSKKQILALSALAVTGLLLLPSANAGAVIVDVRTPEEYQMGHPAGAINIPYTQIVDNIATQGVSKSDTIKVYSRGGSRAEQAKKALQSAGYDKVEIQP